MANWNIARPYALAAFEYSKEKDELETWKAFLESAACAVKHSTVKKLLVDPNISAEKINELFLGVLASQLNRERKNFLLVLSENKRLPVLPAISELFNEYYASYEKITQVRVITAIDIEEAFKQKLIKSLSKLTQNKVMLHCEIDPSIIGGAILHIGKDRVIDDSIRGKLNRLLNNLTG